MKGGQLKEMVAVLKNQVGVVHPKITGFVSELTAIADMQAPESNVNARHIAGILDKFWLWVQLNLPYTKWQYSDEIAPWISFQEALAQKKVLPADYHYRFLYMQLKKDYDGLVKTGLGISDLMPLLVDCSRMLGYVEVGQIESYPFLKLQKKIDAKRPTEVEKIHTIMMLLSSLFCLIQPYCTAEQLKLIPLLIHFRKHTTAEEKRSEFAIFNWISTRPKDCLEFFQANKNYFDIKPVKQLPSLNTVKGLLPSTRNDFIRVGISKHWFYGFIQFIRTEQINQPHVLSDIVGLLHKDLASIKDQSYISALDFVSTNRKLIDQLPPQIRGLAKKAMTTFCLEIYIKERRADPRDKYTMFTLSKNTKINAAEKQKQMLSGASVDFGFFENLALKQGNLKKAVTLYEEPTATCI